MRRVAVIAFCLLTASLEAGVYRYAYRVKDSSADPSERVPQFIVVDTEAELPSTDVGESDTAYSKDTNRVWKRTESTWTEVAGGGGSSAWGDITGTLSDQTDLQTALNAKQASGTFSGIGACGANQWASTLNDTAAPTCTQPAFSNLSGSATDAQVPNTITVDLATTATTANAGDSATSFFSSGTVEVARGGTGTAPGADDQVLVADSTSAATWRAVPDCDNASTSKVLYDTATNTWSCGTDQTGGGGGSPTKLVVTADRQNTTTTFADVTDLTMAVSTATRYIFECVLVSTTAINTTATQISVNGPTTSSLRYVVETGTTATAKHAASQTAYNTVTNPATGAAAVPLPIYLRGQMLTTATGTFAVRFRSEIAASAVNILSGSYCLVY